MLFIFKGLKDNLLKICRINETKTRQIRTTRYESSGQATGVKDFMGREAGECVCLHMHDGGQGSRSRQEEPMTLEICHFVFQNGPSGQMMEGSHI